MLTPMDELDNPYQLDDRDRLTVPGSDLAAWIASEWFRLWELAARQPHAGLI